MLLANDVHATRAFICALAAGTNSKLKMAQRTNPVILRRAVLFILTASMSDARKLSITSNTQFTKAGLFPMPSPSTGEG